MYNVVLDILILDFFSFSLHKFFQKRLKLLFLLYDIFCMPWSMIDYLKIQILEIIIFENFCQNLKVRYFRYNICVWQNSHISNAFLLRDGQTFGYYVWVTKVYVICVHIFGLWKMLVIQFSYNFLYLWNCMKSVWLAFFNIWKLYD